MGERAQADHTAPEMRERLLHALRVLFAAAAAVVAERVAAGVPPLDAAPILLFDELQDLINDARLARLGGLVVFDSLAALIVMYGVDRQVVRAVVSGSSGELDTALAGAGLHGNRWRYHELADPAPVDAAAALEARGYTTAEARAMIDLCGTRLRLLSPPLHLGAGKLRAADFFASSVAAGRGAIVRLFRALRVADAAVLARVLDAVAAADADPRARRPLLEDLPVAARTAGIAPTFYVNLDGALFFQSMLIARSWASARAELAPSWWARVGALLTAPPHASLQRRMGQ